MEYDNTLWSIMGEVTNTAVVSDDRAWKQASLPVKLGGLGVHSAVEVAPSAYLTSLHATSALVEAILPVTFTFSKPSLLDEVVSRWSKGNDFQPSVGVCAIKQKFWDHLHCKNVHVPGTQNRVRGLSQYARIILRALHTSMC